MPLFSPEKGGGTTENIRPDELQFLIYSFLSHIYLVLWAAVLICVIKSFVYCSCNGVLELDVVA